MSEYVDGDRYWTAAESWLFVGGEWTRDRKHDYLAALVTKYKAEPLWLYRDYAVDDWRFPRPKED